MLSAWPTKKDSNMRQFLKETALVMVIVAIAILMLLPLLAKVNYCSLESGPFIACFIKDAPYQLE